MAIRRLAAPTVLLAGFLLLASSPRALALTIGFGGADDPSLHGATGELEIIADGGGSYTVKWRMDFTGFDDAGATSTGHAYLTDVAFKAFSSISAVSLENAANIGTLYYPSNVSNATAGCDKNGSNANMVCVALNPAVDARTDGTFEAVFHVTGTLLDGNYSYRGKFGRGNGWVISESASGGGPPIPEPSSALAFALGGLVLARRLRRH